jgi:hypothetical protein
MSTAQDLEDVELEALADLLFHHRSSDQARAFWDADLGEEAGERVLPRQTRRVTSRRQKAQRHEGDVEDADGEEDAAEGEKLEDSEGGHAVALRQRADEEIGRRADQGAGPADDAHVRQGEEDLRWAHLVVLGELDSEWHEDGESGGVVDERREQGAHHEQGEGRRGEGAAGDHRDAVTDLADQTGGDEAVGEDEHHHHRDDGRVAESRDRLLRGHQSEEEEQAEGGERHHVDR